MCGSKLQKRIADRFGSWQRRWFEIVPSLFDRRRSVHDKCTLDGAVVIYPLVDGALQRQLAGQ